MKTERCDWVSVTSEERWGLKMNPIGKGSLSFTSCPREIYAELGAHERDGVRRRTQHTTHVRNSKGAGEKFHYIGAGVDSGSDKREWPQNYSAKCIKLRCKTNQRKTIVQIRRDLLVMVASVRH